MRKTLILAFTFVATVNVYSQADPPASGVGGREREDGTVETLTIEDIYLLRTYYVDPTLTFSLGEVKNPERVDFINTHDISWEYIDKMNPDMGAYDDDQWAEIAAANKQVKGAYDVNSAFKKAFTPTEINDLASSPIENITVS